MRHSAILNTLQNVILRKPKQRELAKALDSKISLVSNRASRNSEYSLKEIKKICEYFSIDFEIFRERENVDNCDGFSLTNSRTEENISAIEDCPLENIKEETKEKYIVIPYWNDVEELGEKVKNPCFTELLLDVQKLINVYGRSADGLKIIAMTGDEMDGGSSPIKNNDILVIDTNVNNTSSSGIYFYITNKSVFVRRIAEIEGTGLYFSVDNPLYTNVLNDTKSYKELEEVGFKVIGKVVGNESISCRM